jgi:formamidopyrimidine-DNA glycosylase
MPELPEVETIRRDLQKTITGLSVQKVVVYDKRVIRQDVREFIRRVEGQVVVSVSRRGKALVINLDEGHLAVQPMMTGQLIVLKGDRPAIAKETRVVFILSKQKTLVYNDQRLFGRLMWVRSLSDHRHVSRLGPEPLLKEFSLSGFLKALGSRRTVIKTLLLDQHLTAGIGNIYASEILFEAHVSPGKRGCDLSPDEVQRIHAAIRKVLKQAVRMRGTSVRNYRDGSGEEGKYQRIIRVYGRDQEPCPRCRTLIRRTVQAQRSTFFCPQCQK